MTPLVLDSETALIVQGRQAPDLTCVAFSVQGQRWLRHWSDVEPDLDRALSDPEFLIIGQTVAFDMSVFAAHDSAYLSLIFAAYQANRITDTEIRAKLLDIAAGCYRGFDDVDGEITKLNYGLEPLAKRYLNRTLDKNTWRLRYGELRNIPIEQWPEGARVYPLEDVRATEDLFSVQETPENQIYLQDQFRQARAAFWIRLMACWGIHTDAPGIRELARKTKQDQDLIRADLLNAGLLRPDRPVKRRATGQIEIVPGSRNTTLAKERLVNAYQARGLEIPLTATGRVSLEGLACHESGDPLLAKYADYTSLAAVLNKDVPALLQGSGPWPLHPRWETLMETGRTSAGGNAETYGYNVQNPKRKGGIRECFIPRNGYVFAACDYSIAELCSLGQVCKSILGYSALADAINTGRDPHLMIASQILSRTYDEIKARHELGAVPECQSALGKCHCSYCIIDDARQTGKVANFGFPGGLGAAAFVDFALAMYDVRLTLSQAKELKRVWLQTWPEMKDYFRFIDWTVQSGKPIQQLFSGRYRGDLSYTARCNTEFQGLTADMTKSAGFLIAFACYVDTASPLFGCRIVNFVHDEFIVEVPEHRAHEAAIELSRLMIVAAREWCPDVPGLKAKPLLMRRWSKKAKAVWKNERLIPWS